MSRRHFVNIDTLVKPNSAPLTPLSGEALDVLSYLHNAYVTVENERILEIGKMETFKHDSEETHDLSNSWVLPCWVDSHTHTIFAQYRAEEFKMRLAGKSYQEIAAAGGGILNSASKLREMPEDQLYNDALERIGRMIQKGVGGLEIKSGYGLTLMSEIKMLRIVNRLKANCPIPIRATFLGAHAIPAEYKDKRTAYIDLICDEMIPQVAEEKLADYCDVFCETGYFTVEETRRIGQAASRHQLPLKIHTNQFTSIGGIQAAIDFNAKSVDHLEVMSEHDIKDLAQSDVIATILPIAPFFLKDPYPPGRTMIDQGCKLALATDFNPGSAPSHDMALAISLACNYCGLTPEEALNAATVNGAHAIDLQDHVGDLSPGKLANFQIYRKMADISEIPYRICSELIEKVIINGEFYNGKI